MPQELQTAPQAMEPQGGPQANSDTTAAPPERERIARRAYEMYLARGGAEGDPMEDWLAAEREFNATSGSRKPK
jgi:hypothetical protein